MSLCGQSIRPFLLVNTVGSHLFELQPNFCSVVSELTFLVTTDIPKQDPHMYANHNEELILIQSLALMHSVIKKSL